VTVVALTSCISMLLTLGVVAVVRPFRDPGAKTVGDRTPTGGLDTVADVAELTSRVRPAIAQIHARQPGGGEEWGSGVIFQADGMMLTTHHLVDGAEQLSVSLDDGRKMSARIVGADTDTDIAVLDLEGRDFPVARLADSRASMKVGQPAITIGTSRGASPGGPLVRVTVVSAMGQEGAVDGRKFVDMIRTDAAMEPGCTGGAVVDRNGNVIGIAAANIPTSDGMSGYATPIDVARSVASQIIAEGKVQRGWLGIEGSSGSSGVVVGTVLPNSPAAAAGLTPGEVITAISDRKVSSMTALVVQLRKLKPGSTTTLVVERSGERRTVAVTLGERPA
jgi:serine protease DegQ